MAQPPALPTLRAPLPSLFAQQQARRGEGDATYVPPLRRRSISETVRSKEGPPMYDETKLDDTIEKQKKRARGFMRAHSLDESERVLSPGPDGSKTTKKSASVAQREEREHLVDQVRALEAQIDALLLSAGLPTSHDKAQVEATATQNYEIEEALHQGDRYLGHLDSMITNELLLPTVNPISTFIHLPRGMDQRRDILRGMQDLKLRRGVEVATSWLHHLDPTIPYRSEETFTSVTGEYHYHHLEIGQFPNFSTARQLYEVYVEFLYNIDISITEEIGQLTLREEVEDLGPTIWNQRILTVAHDVGFTEELNLVGYAQFYNYSPYTNSPMGIIVNDTVNIDDLYPYVPEERTCKDVQAVSMIYEVPKPGTDEIIVVFKFFVFSVQLMPQFLFDPAALKQLQENTRRWPNLFMKYLHEYVGP